MNGLTRLESFGAAGTYDREGAAKFLGIADRTLRKAIAAGWIRQRYQTDGVPNSGMLLDKNDLLRYAAVQASEGPARVAIDVITREAVDAIADDVAATTETRELLDRVYHEIRIRLLLPTPLREFRPGLAEKEKEVKATETRSKAKATRRGK